MAIKLENFSGFAAIEWIQGTPILKLTALPTPPQMSVSPPQVESSLNASVAKSDSCRSSQSSSSPSTSSSLRSSRKFIPGARWVPIQRHVPVTVPPPLDVRQEGHPRSVHEVVAPVIVLPPRAQSFRKCRADQEACHNCPEDSQADVDPPQEDADPPQEDADSFQEDEQSPHDDADSFQDDASVESQEEEEEEEDEFVVGCRVVVSAVDPRFRRNPRFPDSFVGQVGTVIDFEENGDVIVVLAESCKTRVFTPEELSRK